MHFGCRPLAFGVGGACSWLSCYVSQAIHLAHCPDSLPFEALRFPEVIFDLKPDVLIIHRRTSKVIEL